MPKSPCVFADSNSTIYAEGSTYNQISMSAFILEIWPVEVSDTTIFFDNTYYLESKTSK